MPIFGYGEDSLSFWSLTYKTSEILRPFDDPTGPAETLLYFRPSFGRQGNNPVAPGGTADSAQFGEFDAVLGTPRGVYLIETKWSRSSEINGACILLRAAQIRRHEVFRAYLTAWRFHRPANWNAFHAAQSGLLQVGDIRYPVAPVGSQLAGNLETVLRRLSSCGESVWDVLLYARLASGPLVNTVCPGSFRLITIDCPSEAGFIDLQSV